MKKYFFALLLTLAGLAQAELISGRVIGVIDGDTIDIPDASKTTHRIRLAGIYAPERKQAFGARSKQTLSEMVYGETVTVDTNKIDRLSCSTSSTALGWMPLCRKWRLNVAALVSYSALSASFCALPPALICLSICSGVMGEFSPQKR